MWPKLTTAIFKEVIGLVKPIVQEQLNKVMQEEKREWGLMLCIVVCCGTQHPACKRAEFLQRQRCQGCI